MKLGSKSCNRFCEKLQQVLSEKRILRKNLEVFNQYKFQFYIEKNLPE